MFLMMRRDVWANTWIRERNAARMQLTSDLCDLVIPLSAIGFVNFDEGIVGLAGTTSSLIGLLAQWRKTA